MSNLREHLRLSHSHYIPSISPLLLSDRSAFAIRFSTFLLGVPTLRSLKQACITSYRYTGSGIQEWLRWVSWLRVSRRLQSSEGLTGWRVCLQCGSHTHLAVSAGCRQKTWFLSQVDLFIGLSVLMTCSCLSLPTPTTVSHVASLHFHIVPLITQVNPIQCGRGLHRSKNTRRWVRIIGAILGAGSHSLGWFKAICCPIKPGL